MSTVTAPHPHASKQAERHTDAHHVPSALGRYTDDRTGATREIVCLPGAGASRLVIDRLAGAHTDPRLVAHLAPDEPPENARIVSEVYLADHSRGGCRAVNAEDLELARHATPPPPNPGGTASQPPLLDTDGHLYSIREVANDESFPTLRWTRSCQPGQQEPFDHVTLRDVIARLSDYEPARTITSAALAVHHDSRRLSTHRLRGELERVSTSPIVLNRGLREAVQRKVTRGDLSMSQIAMRCGRIKQDRRGNRSGETSWLARRIGQLREGGKAGPSPWVHTDVLALIVRDGLGASPREVEL